LRWVRTLSWEKVAEKSLRFIESRDEIRSTKWK